MTGPLTPDVRRLDQKVTALLVVTGVTLLVVVLALFGVVDLAT